jgi:hypothetical protein
MTPRTPKIRLLRDRRRALDDQIVKVEAELGKLKEEAKEFEIAERVLSSLGGDDEDESGEVLPTDSGSAALSAVSIMTGSPILSTPSLTEAPRKPPGIPSTPEMIFLALKGASKTKAPFEIVEFIKEKWWPSATSKDISPVAWRLASEGRLFKDNSGYGLPPDPRDRPGPRVEKR